MGSDGGLKLLAMEGSESDWNQAGSKLPLIVLASSAAGKDNLKSIFEKWNEELEGDHPQATHCASQGNLTLSGLIQKLKKNGGSSNSSSPSWINLCKRSGRSTFKKRIALNSWTGPRTSVRGPRPAMCACGHTHRHLSSRRGTST